MAVTRRGRSAYWPQRWLPAGHALHGGGPGPERPPGPRAWRTARHTGGRRGHRRTRPRDAVGIRPPAARSATQCARRGTARPGTLAASSARRSTTASGAWGDRLEPMRSPPATSGPPWTPEGPDALADRRRSVRGVGGHEVALGGDVRLDEARPPGPRAGHAPARRRAAPWRSSGPKRWPMSCTSPATCSSGSSGLRPGQLERALQAVVELAQPLGLLRRVRRPMEASRSSSSASVTRGRHSSAGVRGRSPPRTPTCR